MKKILSVFFLSFVFVISLLFFATPFFVPQPSFAVNNCAPGACSPSCCNNEVSGPMCNGTSCSTQGRYCSAGSCVYGWAGGGPTTGCINNCQALPGACTPGDRRCIGTSGRTPTYQTCQADKTWGGYETCTTDSTACITLATSPFASCRVVQKYGCQNNACVPVTSGGTYYEQTCGESCGSAIPSALTLSCPTCSAPYTLNDAKTQCVPPIGLRKAPEDPTAISCNDIGGADASCRGTGTQGGCIGGAAGITNPECYINIPGYCDLAENEQPFGCNGTSCDTAIGNVSTDVGGFIGSIFVRLLGVIGGIATLLIIISGYRIMASRGDPEKMQHAREQLTAAIVGLLFVVFSLVILQVIGYDILRLPGFNP